MNDRMQELKLSDLKEKLENRKSGERLVFREVQLEKGDLSGTDLSNTDFTLCSFDGVMLNNVDFRYSSVEMRCLTDAPCTVQILKMQI